MDAKDKRQAEGHADAAKRNNLPFIGDLDLANQHTSAAVD